MGFSSLQNMRYMLLLLLVPVVVGSPSSNSSSPTTSAPAVATITSANQTGNKPIAKKKRFLANASVHSRAMPTAPNSWQQAASPQVLSTNLDSSATSFHPPATSDMEVAATTSSGHEAGSTSNVAQGKLKLAPASGHQQPRSRTLGSEGSRSSSRKKISKKKMKRLCKALEYVTFMECFTNTPDLKMALAVKCKKTSTVMGGYDLHIDIERRHAVDIANYRRHLVGSSSRKFWGNDGNSSPGKVKIWDEQSGQFSFQIDFAEGGLGRKPLDNYDLRLDGTVKVSRNWLGPKRLDVESMAVVTFRPSLLDSEGVLEFPVQVPAKGKPGWAASLLDEEALCAGVRRQWHSASLRVPISESYAAMQNPGGETSVALKL